MSLPPLQRWRAAVVLGRHHGLTGAQCLVLDRLAYHDGPGGCRVSIAQLRAETGLGDRWTRASLIALEALGLVFRQRSGRSYMYRIAYPTEEQIAALTAAFPTSNSNPTPALSAAITPPTPALSTAIDPDPDPPPPVDNSTPHRHSVPMLVNAHRHSVPKIPALSADQRRRERSTSVVTPNQTEGGTVDNPSNAPRTPETVSEHSLTSEPPAEPAKPPAPRPPTATPEPQTAHQTAVALAAKLAFHRKPNPER